MLPRNLISESVLVGETIELLQSFGGRASAVRIVDAVMKISAPEPDLAKLLVADLVELDPRLQFADDETLELIEHNFDAQLLEKSDFVVFDLETTGSQAPPERITEIGAFRISNGRIVADFQRLINPEKAIPPFISQLTGISDAMVKTAPKFAEVAADFLEFIGDSVLVAHNAKFDINFLNHEVGRVFKNYRVANPHLCTVRLARSLLPDLQNHRLHTVAEHYAFTIENRHRAGDDALATAKIFIEFLEKLKLRGVKDLKTARYLKK